MIGMRRKGLEEEDVNDPWWQTAAFCEFICGNGEGIGDVYGII
jgi:hypothetical protein